jgi:NAD(P)-dependent dehydrogenase (short-subunit alcohol dehydrogenase family)
MSLEHKVAIVTGGGSGIGRAIALAYARAGAHLAIADINLEMAESVKQAIVDMKRQAAAIQCDVSQKADVAYMVRKVVEEFGAVDILVNNAGITLRSRVIDMPVEDWDRTMAINLRGPFLCAQAVLPHMMQQRSGKIINISSDSGKHGWATGSAYCASKFGLLGLTEALSKEVAEEYGIRVNAICPGFVDTPMGRQAITAIGAEVDWSKVIQPEQIADIAVFLASDGSRAMFGVSVDAFGLPSIFQ